MPTPTTARGTGAKPEPSRWFALDAAQLQARLAPALPETQPAAVTLELPYPDGTLHRFAITQMPVMAPALAARYPEIRTYAGRTLDDAGTAVRLENTPAGLHARILTPTGPLSILAHSGATPGATRHYQSRVDAPGDFDCLALPAPGPARRSTMGGTPPTAPAPYGAQLRTLRLALAATGEYTQNLGGGSVANTLASMVTLVNALNAMYKRDLALRLQLVANNYLLIYTDAATDPYDNSNPTSLMNANQGVVSTALDGAENYDLGHVLGYRGNGYSGVAYVGVVCSSNLAAGGTSTGATASYMAEMVTHEIGHQLGSSHTFNGDQGRGGGGNRSADLAYESGGGNTIMSYDSRCAPDNVGSGIRYFHAGSISAILPRLTCGSLAASGNQPLSVSVPPSTYTIP